jgi:hypothetical protein
MADSTLVLTAIANIQASLEQMKAKLGPHQEEIRTNVIAKLDTHHERMMARMDSQLQKMETCREKTNATDLEANPEEIESEVEHEEVPKEEAAV